MSTNEDRWLLPRHQTEYPTWDLVAEEKLHGRREATFLTLTTCFLVATVSLFVLGATHAVDLAALIERVLPDLEVPVALQLPLGVLPAALGFAAVMLACELYGRRRAAALLLAGALASIAIVGLIAVADLDRAADTLFAVLPFAAYYLVAHVAGLLTFDALRERSGGRHFWLRALVASVSAQLLGWTAFGVAMYASSELALPVVAGGADFTIACAVALVLPLALAARALTLFLRVARYEPGFEIVEERPLERAKTPILPFSASEMRFFSEGDASGSHAV